MNATFFGSPRRTRIRNRRYVRPLVEELESRTLLAVFVVNEQQGEHDANLGDGHCDIDVAKPGDQCVLRAAIEEANYASDKDTIEFNLTYAGVETYVILPVGAPWPDIVYPVIINGYSQPGSLEADAIGPAVIRIVLDGSLAPLGSNGLTIEGGDSVVRGLVIQRFVMDPSTGENGFGIALGVKGGNLIEGNFLGTDPDGTSAAGNQSGIGILSGNNTIGGTTPAARNVISGNLFNGIQIGGLRGGVPIPGVERNVIVGNYIGTDASGAKPLGNDNGVRITRSAGQNTIGGTVAGAGNVLSGNRFQGVVIDPDASAIGGNVVQGNFIGTDGSGLVTDPDGVPDSGDELGNGDDGVEISGVPNNTIGGPTREAGNVISGNTGSGVLIVGPTASINLVQNNRIGTNAAGDLSSTLASMGNGVDGVQIQQAPLNRVEDNLISNNEINGIGVFGTSAVANQIQGNLIGTDLAGLVAMGNTAGVGIFDARSTIVGGTRRNVISGNTMHGVYIAGGTASDNLVQGNFIGTDVTGLAALGNMFDGVRIIDAARNTLGGSTAATRNLISGNDRHGVHISGGTATGNVVLSNLVGLDLTGQNKLGNRGSGVVIDGSPLNIVGQQAGLANVISGNNEHGILITGANASLNSVAGNFIGTDQTGTTALGNGQAGIALVNTRGNTIGGDRTTKGNLIAGNGDAGVLIEGGESNPVLGNLIGTDNTVANALPNLYGVEIYNSTGNAIGGVSAATQLANVFSGNLLDGVYIHGNQARRNVIDGNYIGTNKDGTAAIPNGSDGIEISEAPDNRIGVENPASFSNIISGNARYGVYVFNTNNNLLYNNVIGIGDGDAPLPNILGGVFLHQSSGNSVGGPRDQHKYNVISGNATGPGVRIAGSRLDEVMGNFIGTDSLGTQPRPNLVGIIIDRSSEITVGASFSSTESNLISGNVTDGIMITESRNNDIRGNVIGLDLARETALPNGGNGVVVDDSGGNEIGRDATGTFAFGNFISGNLGSGILIQGSQSRSNAVRGNFIGTNGRGDTARGNGLFGIRLEYASENLIGGVRNPDGNLISGNRDTGLSIWGGRSNVVSGNFIGTDYTGVKSIPNLGGLEVVESDHNWIGLSPGFDTPDYGNLISGNLGTGLALAGVTAHDNRVLGN